MNKILSLDRSTSTTKNHGVETSLKSSEREETERWRDSGKKRRPADPSVLGKANLGPAVPTGEGAETRRRREEHDQERVAAVRVPQQKRNHAATLKDSRRQESSSGKRSDPVGASREHDELPISVSCGKI
jgi:hypothetical protein